MNLASGLFPVAETSLSAWWLGRYPYGTYLSYAFLKLSRERIKEKDLSDNLFRREVITLQKGSVYLAEEE